MCALNNKKIEAKLDGREFQLNLSDRSCQRSIKKNELKAKLKGHRFKSEWYSERVSKSSIACDTFSCILNRFRELVSNKILRHLNEKNAFHI